MSDLEKGKKDKKKRNPETENKQVGREDKNKRIRGRNKKQR